MAFDDQKSTSFPYGFWKNEVKIHPKYSYGISLEGQNWKVEQN